MLPGLTVLNAVVKESVHLSGQICGILSIFKVYHLHRDAVLTVVNRRHRMERIIDREILNDSEVEIQAVRPDTGFENRIGLIQVHCQRRVHVFMIIPCHDRRIVLFIRASLQKYTDCITGKKRPIGISRCKV